MIPNTEDQSINGFLFQICNLSPTAKNNIELELYRQNTESDGSTQEFILSDVFGDLIGDLQTIGIVISFDYSDIVLDVNKLSQFLHMVRYLLPNTLYDILKNNEKIQNCIDHILKGSLGYNETLIQTYLSELGGLDGQRALVPEISDIVDQLYSMISQTSVFTDYIKNLLDLTLQEKLMTSSNPDDHKEYRDYIRDLISRLSDAVNLFSNDSLYDQMCLIQNQIIRDLTASDNFINYRYIFLMSPDHLPEEFIESYNLKWYHYRVSHTWCIDYFNIRNLTPTPLQTNMMYCFSYALYKSQSEYETQIKETRQSYPAPEVEFIIKALYQE